MLDATNAKKAQVQPNYCFVFNSFANHFGYLGESKQRKKPKGEAIPRHIAAKKVQIANKFRQQEVHIGYFIAWLRIKSNAAKFEQHHHVINRLKNRGKKYGSKQHQKSMNKKPTAVWLVENIS
jgi:hypothetical protein